MKPFRLTVDIKNPVFTFSLFSLLFYHFFQLYNSTFTISLGKRATDPLTGKNIRI